MIRIQDLKKGDFVLAVFEGEKWEGMVKEVNTIDKLVCVETNVQDFYFKPDVLFPIPVNEDQLSKLGFVKQENDNGSIKYIKGPFRIYLPEKGNFSRLEIYYREDRRHLVQPLSVHELQNHYSQMTKVNLTRN